MPPPKKSNDKINLEKPKIFIVHGRHEGKKEMVARFIQNLECEPIILHEKPNKGKTIIQKFQDHSDVEFAVVLLTADDRGGPVDTPFDQQHKRARQNVILELGFFLAKLGLANVCCLCEEGVELPSDYDGMLYIKFDGNWKTELTRELESANVRIKK